MALRLLDTDKPNQAGKGVTTAAKLLALARAHWHACNWTDAERTYRQVIALDDNCTEAVRELANLLAQRASVDGAPAENRTMKSAGLASADHAEVLNELGISHGEAGRLDEAIACFEQASRLQPYASHLAQNLRIAQATRETSQGLSFAEQKRWNEAEACYRRAIAIEPNHLPAIGNLGTVMRELLRLDEAEQCYARVVELDPTSAAACYNLAILARDRSDNAEAVSWFRRAISLRPEIFDAHYALGQLLLAENLMEAAEASFRRAIALQPESNAARLGLSFSLLARGQFAEGWFHYEARLPLIGMGDEALTEPRWTGESLAGKVILLRCEQGFGDSLQFVRYAEILKRQGATVAVVCRKPLERILATSPGVDRVLLVGQPLGAFDFHCPLASVPGVLGTTADTIPSTIPYLWPDEANVARWRAELGPVSELRIGIAWQGDPSHPDHTRSIALSHFLGIARTPGVRVYSLQFGAGREQLADLPAAIQIEDLGDRLGDFHNTAALVRNLDLVITCDSAPAHVAGALGVPVWVVLPFAAEWRWQLDRSDTPWYPTMRLFRQPVGGRWDTVFATVVAALHELQHQRAERLRQR